MVTGYNRDDVFKLTIQEVLTVCYEKFYSINASGAPFGRLVDESLRKCAMLAQVETKNIRATYAKAKFAHIQPISQQQTVQVEIEPMIRCRA